MTSGDCPVETARPATVTDREVLEELRDEARAATVGRRGGAALVGRDRPRPRMDARVEAALAGDAGVTVVAGLLDDLVVGYALAEWTDTDATGRAAAVLELWVTPEARGVGVGEAMIGEVIDWARTAGCGELDAEALPGDRDTKNFFETHGLVARQIRVSRSL